MGALARDIYRGFASGLGWFAVALQYGLILEYRTDGSAVAAAIRYLSYFTDLSNVLVALAMTLPWLAPQTVLGRFFLRPSVRTAILVYIIVVAAIYHLLLRHLWNPQGWQLIADVIEHIGMPLFYAVDWLLFVPKGSLQFRSALAWLLFPAAYAAWTLIHGAVTGFYPYPFMSVRHLGYDHVLVNLGGLVALFAVLGLVLIALDRGLGRILNHRVSSSSTEA